MSFQREIWQNWNLPKPCPTCKNGTIDFKINSTNSIINETVESIEMTKLYSYYERDYIFSLQLKCNNCGEYVAVSGKKSTWYDQDSYTHQQIERIEFNPIFYYPAPNIIEIPKLCSEEFTTKLKESFSLYWLNLSSCANKIRASLEVLMSDFKIDETKITKKGKKIEIVLHDRIEIFKEIYDEVGGYFMTIKLVGNAGTHSSDMEEISKKDILDTYELLEYSLEKLYKEKEDRVLKINNNLSNKMNLKKNRKT